MRDPWEAFVNPLVGYIHKVEVFNALIMAVESLGCFSEPHVPKNKPKPVSDYSFSFFINFARKWTKFFPVIYKCLDSHMWPKSLDFFCIRLSFKVLIEFHSIFHSSWMQVALNFFDPYKHSIFVQIFFHAERVSESELHRVSEWLDQIVVNDAYFLRKNILHHCQDHVCLDNFENTVPKIRRLIINTCRDKHLTHGIPVAAQIF